MVIKIILIAFLSLTLLDESSAKPSSDWARVQHLELGSIVRISLYKKDAPRGMRRFSGRLVSASKDRAMITVNDGSTRTFDMPDVRKVEIRRPVKKRWGAWGLAGGCAVATFALVWAWPDFALLGASYLRSVLFLRGAAIFVAPTAVVSLLALPYMAVYHVPEKHRVLPAALQAPTINQSQKVD